MLRALAAAFNTMRALGRASLVLVPIEHVKICNAKWHKQPGSTSTPPPQVQSM